MDRCHFLVVDGNCMPGGRSRPTRCNLTHHHLHHSSKVKRKTTVMGKIVKFIADNFVVIMAPSFSLYLSI